MSAAVDARARKAIADVTAAGDVDQESSGQRRREHKKDAAALPVLSADELAAYKQLLTDSLLTISLQASFSEHAGVASAPSFEALHRQQLQQSLFDLMLVMR